MAFCLMLAKKSPDPKTKVGACVLDSNRNIIGSGYNQMPNGTGDRIPWTNVSKEPLNNKHLYVCHAELNAIVNSKGTMEGGTIYSTLFPCNECAKLITQIGIKEVVFLSNKKNHKVEFQASEKLFSEAGISFRRVRCLNFTINIDFGTECVSRG